LCGYLADDERPAALAANRLGHVFSAAFPVHFAVSMSFGQAKSIATLRLRARSAFRSMRHVPRPRAGIIAPVAKDFQAMLGSPVSKFLCQTTIPQSRVS
jgi:hypothetical protein